MVEPVTTQRVWAELVANPPMDKLLEGLDRGDFVDSFNDTLQDSLNRLGGLEVHTEIDHGYGELDGATLKWKGQWVGNVLEEGEIPVDTDEDIIRRNFQKLGAKVLRAEWSIDRLKGWNHSYEPYSVYAVSLEWPLDFQKLLNTVFGKSKLPAIIEKMVQDSITRMG